VLRPGPCPQIQPERPQGSVVGFAQNAAIAHLAHQMRLSEDPSSILL
jgi:hypothetical protein